MSYPDQAAPRRPGVVVALVALLLLMAAGSAVYAVAVLLVASGTADRFKLSARATGAGRTEIDEVVSLLYGSTALAVAVGVLMALVLAGLALGLRSGRPGARVGTWVVAGLGLCCGCCGLAALVGQRAAPLRVTGDSRDTMELLGRLGDAYPGWWIPLNAALSVAQVLGYLLVAALLTVPAAGAFLQRRPASSTGPAPASPGSAYGPPSAPPGSAYPASAPPGSAYGPPAGSPYGPPSGPASVPPGYGPPAGSPPHPPAHGPGSPWAAPTPPPASAPPGPTPPTEERQ